MKFNLIKFLLTFFAIFVVIVAGYQLFGYFYKSAATEFAVQIDCEDTVKTQGFFVRNESIIKSNGSKYYDITVPSGGKVSRQGTIANMYSNETAAKNQSKIRELQEQIDQFKSVISAADGYSDLTLYSNDIRKKAISLNYNYAEGNITEAFVNASDFTTGVIKSKIASGEVTDYSEKLKLLQAEMAELKSNASAVTSYVSSPVSGYFVHKVDGLESSLNMKMTDELTASGFLQIEELCRQITEPDNAIGRVAEGSDWRVCFKTSYAEFEKLTVGSTLYIRVPSVTESKIKCSVTSIQREGDDLYIVLQSNIVTGELLSQRVCEIEIVVDTFSGLRIDKNAIRKIDGKEGVFVKSNGILRYREISILYIGSTYAVIKYDSTDKSKVQVYDEVVVKGSGLYDGKVMA